jgi:hypothetical protein
VFALPGNRRLNQALQIGRIFATQKPGYPLQFVRFAAKFRFYPLRVSYLDAVLVMNRCFPRATLIKWTLISVALLFFSFSCGKLRKMTLK